MLVPKTFEKSLSKISFTRMVNKSSKKCWLDFNICILCFVCPGCGVLPNSLLHLKRWSSHLQSFNKSQSKEKATFPDFNQHPKLATLQEAFEQIKGRSQSPHINSTEIEE